jgi:hypothetical protein
MSIISKTAIAGLAVAVALAVSGTAAFAKGKHGGASKPVSGTVTAVDQTSITIDTKKLGSQKYTVNATTTYETAAKKKGEAGTPATLDNVQVGATVLIEGTTDLATKVTISKAAKHKKKK